MYTYLSTSSNFSGLILQIKRIAVEKHGTPEVPSLSGIYQASGTGHTSVLQLEHYRAASKDTTAILNYFGIYPSLVYLVHDLNDITMKPSIEHFSGYLISR